MYLIAPLFIGSWVILVALSMWKPQRMRNAFVLVFALMITGFMVAGLFGKYMVHVLFLEFATICLIILMVPVILIYNGINVMRLEGRSLSNMLSLILGIVIAVGELSFVALAFNMSLNGTQNSSRLLDFVLFITNTIIYFSIIILTFVLYNLYIQYIPRFARFEYVIIHGCGLINGDQVSPLLASRLDKAIATYNIAKTKPIMIPSGGRGNDELLSEADAMANYLIEHGIPEEHIIREDQSTTTLENIANCKKIIDSRGGTKRYRIALVSSNYHIYRCLLYADKIKMKCIGIGAPVAWYYWPTALLREFAAVFTRGKYLIWILLGYVILVLLPLLQ